MSIAGFRWLFRLESCMAGSPLNEPKPDTRAMPVAVDSGQVRAGRTADRYRHMDTGKPMAKPEPCVALDVHRSEFHRGDRDVGATIAPCRRQRPSASGKQALSSSTARLTAGFAISDPP